MRVVALVCAGLALVGCVTSPITKARVDYQTSILAAHRTYEADAVRAYDKAAEMAGYERIELERDGFVLVARMKKNPRPQARLEIAIAGDILPTVVTYPSRTEWVTVAQQNTADEGTFFPDADPSRDIIILERPCYAVTAKRDKNCEDMAWTREKRMHPQVIEAMSKAVTAVKKMRAKSEVHLLGVSAGGSIALLIAARRDDVGSVMTQAAPFDFAFVDPWQRAVMAKVNEAMGLKPWNGPAGNAMCGNPCEDPLSKVSQLGTIPQIHFYGSSDVIVPPENAVRFARALKGRCATFVQVAMTHYDEAATKMWRRGIQDMPPNC
jgi:hypothetical protein